MKQLIESADLKLETQANCDFFKQETERVS